MAGRSGRPLQGASINQRKPVGEALRDGLRGPAVTSPSRVCVRPSGLAAIAVVLLLCGLGWALIESCAAPPSPQRRAAMTLAQELGLTDLVLVTEARYLRHLALADRHAAFQDHPLALEHFPSAALIGVPRHLRVPDAPLPSDARPTESTRPAR
jgi:hypothetical protein